MFFFILDVSSDLVLLCTMGTYKYMATSKKVFINPNSLGIIGVASKKGRSEHGHKSDIPSLS